jgi:hypothetical protein
MGGSTTVLVSPIDEKALTGGIAQACVSLAPSVVPARMTRPLQAAEATVVSRGSAVAGEAGGSLTVNIAGPSGTGDYRDHQAGIVLSHLEIDPVRDPYMVLPLTVPRVAAMTIDAIAQDGSRITRYIPIQDGIDTPQQILVNWESFPRYEAEPIASIDIRIILPDDVETERINVGPLTLITGPEGLVSGTDALARGPDEYELRPTTSGGLDGLTFLRDFR